MKHILYHLIELLYLRDIILYWRLTFLDGGRQSKIDNDKWKIDDLLPLISFIYYLRHSFGGGYFFIGVGLLACLFVCVFVCQ